MKPLAVAACLLFSACSLPFDLAFDVDQEVPEQSIPGSPIPDPPVATMELPLPLAVDSALTGTSAGSVTLEALYLDITASSLAGDDSDDWSFIEHVDLFVESTLEGTSLPRLRVAAAEAPGEVSRLDFVPEDVNLLPYIQEGCKLSAVATGRAPADEVSYGGLATFHVDPL